MGDAAHEITAVIRAAHAADGDQAMRAQHAAVADAVQLAVGGDGFRRAAVVIRLNGGIRSDGSTGMVLLIFVVGSRTMPVTSIGASASFISRSVLTFDEEPMSCVSARCARPARF